MSDSHEELSSMMEAILSMLDDENTRRNAFFVLRQESDLPPQVFKKLSSFLESDDQTCKEEAFLALYNKNSLPAEIEQKVFSLLNDSNPNIKELVISQIILDWPQSESAEKLIVSQILNSLDEDLKLKVLKEIRFKEILSTDLQHLILQFLQSSNLNLVIAALECYMDEPKEFAPEIFKFLTEQFKQDSHPILRNLSARVLSHFTQDNEQYKSLVKKYEASEQYSSDYVEYMKHMIEQTTGVTEAEMDAINLSDLTEVEDDDAEIIEVEQGDLKTAGRLFGQAAALIRNYLFDLYDGEGQQDQNILLQAIQKSELGLTAFDEDSLKDNVLIGAYCNLYLAHFLLDQKDKALEFLKLAEACYLGTHDPLVCLLFGEFYLDENKNLALAKEYIFRAFVTSEAEVLNSARNPAVLLKAIGRSENFLENLDSEVQQDKDIQNYLKSKKSYESALKNCDIYHDERNALGRDSRINWKDSAVEPPGKKPDIKFLDLGLKHLQEAWDLLPEPKLKWALSYDIAHNFYWNAREKHDIDKAIEFAQISHLIQYTPSDTGYLKDCGLMYYKFKKDNLKAKEVFEKIWALEGPDGFKDKGDEEYLSLIGKS